MLPILRLIPVGGVSLAILLLILALKPPGDSLALLPTSMVPARGPLLARGEHPEWRQLLIHAALRRSEQLDALRLLPDTPLPSEPAEPDNPETKTTEPARDVAGIPASQNDVDPEDVTGSVVQPPDHSIPVDIGATSSTELPVLPEEETPPVIMMPKRSRPPDQSLNVTPDSANPADRVVNAREIGKGTASRSHRAGPAQATPKQFNLLQALFGGFNASRPASRSRR